MPDRQSHRTTVKFPRVHVLYNLRGHLPLTIGAGEGVSGRRNPVAAESRSRGYRDPDHVSMQFGRILRHVVRIVLRTPVSHSPVQVMECRLEGKGREEGVNITRRKLQSTM